MVLETHRILDEAEKQGIVLRLFGGMAFRLRCPTASHRSLQRKYVDIDFMGLSKQSKRIGKLFMDLEYVPREFFNALQGDRRLIFNDIEQGRRVDIFLDVFQMCHKFDFRNRLSMDKLTIPLADLLATKLQVVEITEREYRDIIALVHDHDVGEAEANETIDGAYLAKLCADDWGIYRTFSINIENILRALENYGLPSADRELVSKRLTALQERIESIPKSVRWTMRARIGESKKWYELPERDKEVVDSRIYGSSESSKS
jgi:hypothetical protein